MDSSKEPKGKIEPYHHPAAGWGALKYVAINLIKERVNGGNYRMLFRQNQPDGFDCPGCAWPDPRHTSSFEFCENGAKAVTWEATVKRVDPDFFARHTATELWSWSDHQLEDAGRLTEPLRYDAETDHYVPITWDEAFARAGASMQALAHADQAEFYRKMWKVGPAGATIPLKVIKGGDVRDLSVKSIDRADFLKKSTGI